jgi:hypothetical protein
MAKRRKARKARKGGAQRAKFKHASAKCRHQVGSTGVPAFSKKSWTMFGSCMKKAL